MKQKLEKKVTVAAVGIFEVEEMRITIDGEVKYLSELFADFDGQEISLNIRQSEDVIKE